MTWLSGVARRERTRGLLAVCLVFSSFHIATAGAANLASFPADTAVSHSISQSVLNFASWAIKSGDSMNLPFVIVDKIDAKLFVFDARGALRSSTSVLLGLARGDHSVPGIGTRPIAKIKPSERTTPAGRFVGERGKNLDGEDIIWIDYEAALAIHRLRAGSSREQRLLRLGSTTPADHRISYGCVVTPVAFYEQEIAPAFAGGKRIVYVLPESRSLMEVFSVDQDL